MHERLQRTAAQTRTLLPIGVAIAIAYWLCEGIVHALAFERRGLVNGLFPSDIHELWMRSLISCTVIGFGVYGQLLVNKLHETSERYKALFDNAADAIFIADSGSGVITDANPAASKLLLQPHDEIVGLHQSKLHPPVEQDDATRIFDTQVNDSEKRREARPAETTVLRSDGVEVPVEIMAKTVDVGGTSMLQGIFRDATERKRAEASLRESEKKYRTLSNNIPAMVFRAKPDWSVEFISNSEKVCGYSPQDFFERRANWLDLVHPDDREAVQESGRSFAKAPGSLIDEYRIINTSDDIRWIEDHKTSLFTEEGVFTGVDGVIFDITERKKASIALKESKARLHLAQQIADIGSWQWKVESGEVSWSDKTYCIFGFEPGEFTPKYEDFFNRVHPDDREAVTKTNEKAMTQKEPIDYEYRVVTKDGTVRTVRSRAQVFYDEDDDPVNFMGTIQDITKQKQAEEELRSFRERMGQAERLTSLGTLSATVAHELAQPLTVLSLSLDNTLDRLEKSSCPDVAYSDLKSCIAAVSTVTSTVDRFRTFARKSSDHNLSEVDLQAVGERTVELLSGSGRRMRATLRLEGVDKLPHIRSNEKDLEQLFFALVENAIQAGDDKDRSEVTISGIAKDGQIELRFSDNCGGIAPENLNRILEPFFTTKAGQATGLGLCVVQDVLSRVQGKLRVESTFGEGSTFFVTLPIGKQMK